MAKAKESLPEMLDHRKVARKLGVCPRTVREWVHKGWWPSPVVVVGTLFFWRESDVTSKLTTGRWPWEPQPRGEGNG